MAPFATVSGIEAHGHERTPRNKFFLVGALATFLVLGFVYSPSRRSLRGPGDEATLRRNLVYGERTGMWREFHNNCTYDLLRDAFNQSFTLATPLMLKTVDNNEWAISVRHDDTTCYVVPEHYPEAHNPPDDDNLMFTQVYEDLYKIVSYTNQVEINYEVCGCALPLFFGVCMAPRTCMADGLAVPQIAHPWEAMHEGFARLWENSNCSSSDRVVLTGYGPGGSMASLLAAVLVKNNMVDAEKLRLVTFGSFAVLETPLAEELHQKFPQWQVRMSNDIYPRFGQNINAKHYGDIVCDEDGCSHSVFESYQWGREFYRAMMSATGENSFENVLDLQYIPLSNYE